MMSDGVGATPTGRSPNRWRVLANDEASATASGLASEHQSLARGTRFIACDPHCTIHAPRRRNA
jgi:hypothetical protein